MNEKAKSRRALMIASFATLFALAAIPTVSSADPDPPALAPAASASPTRASTSSTGWW